MNRGARPHGVAAALRSRACDVGDVRERGLLKKQREVTRGVCVARAPGKRKPEAGLPRPTVPRFPPFRFHRHFAFVREPHSKRSF